MTTDTSSFFGEQQSNDVPRDQWGRYRLPDADGSESGWTRATTFAATLAEQYGLSIWHQRQVVWGLSRRTDLIELAATIAGPEDKKALGSIVDEAHIAAGTEAKANRGTALHKASEIGDRANGNVGAVPPQFRQDYAAYRDTINRAGIEIMPEWIERVMITPEYHVAGTPDRLVYCAWDNKIRVLDLKTGNIDYAQLEWAVQLALYAHAKAARNYATNTYEQLPEIATDYAIVAHVRPESGVCELYRVNIAMGWTFARLCAEVRDARQHKALLTPLVVEPGNAFAGVQTVSRDHDGTLTVTMNNNAATFTPTGGVPSALTAAAAPEIERLNERTREAMNDAVSMLDTAAFWTSAPEDSDEGLTHNGVPLSEYGVSGTGAQMAGRAPNAQEPTAPPEGTEELASEQVAHIDASDAEAQREASAQELAKRPKAQLQQIARDLMAQVPGSSIKLTQHRIKIAREIIAAASAAGAPVPGVTGSGAHNAKPTAPQPGDDAITTAKPGEKVYASTQDAQIAANTHDLIRSAPTVGALEKIRENAGPRWTDAMTESARARAAELDSASQAPPMLTPLEMVRGATSRETLSKAWEIATNQGSNLDGWTAELDTAAKERMAAL